MKSSMLAVLRWVRRTASNASLISNRSMSFAVRPAFFSAFCAAGAMPVSMIVGSEPITATEPVEPPSAPIPAFAPPEVVPGTYAYLKRWTFVAVLLGVWVVAGAAGAGLYEWWFAALNKTAPVFVTLVWVVLCTVGGLIASTAPRRPLLSALGIALMSSPLASTVAAAVLYGSYVFGWFGR